MGVLGLTERNQKAGTNSREMTGVVQVATCSRSQVGIGSRGHDLAAVFLMRTATSCSVTGSNTVSEGADLGEMRKIQKGRTKCKSVLLFPFSLISTTHTSSNDRFSKYKLRLQNNYKLK